MGFLGSAIAGLVKGVLSFFGNIWRENELREAKTKAAALEAREASVEESRNLEDTIRQKQNALNTTLPESDEEVLNQLRNAGEPK